MSEDVSDSNRVARPCETLPEQYPVGDRCRECSTLLNRYNPYVVCGPCRKRIALEILPSDEHIDNFGAVERRGAFLWERIPKRQVVRRGALGLDG